MRATQTTNGMDAHMLSEADEAANAGKQRALVNLREQVFGGESMGVVDMYERAAWNCGATVAETEAILQEKRKGGTK